MACLNPGLDDLQERTVATGTRAVADYEQPLGLHPGATPANPGVQKGLILRGFLEAILRWRRGRDSLPWPLGPRKRKKNQRFSDNRGGLCVPTVCTGAHGSAQVDSSGRLTSFNHFRATKVRSSTCCALADRPSNWNGTTSADPSQTNGGLRCR